MPREISGGRHPPESKRLEFAKGEALAVSGRTRLTNWTGRDGGATRGARMPACGLWSRIASMTSMQSQYRERRRIFAAPMAYRPSPRRAETADHQGLAQSRFR